MRPTAKLARVQSASTANGAERAESLRPIGNDDPLLRWNACARLLMRDQHLAPEPEIQTEPLFLE